MNAQEAKAEITTAMSRLNEVVTAMGETLRTGDPSHTRNVAGKLNDVGHALKHIGVDFVDPLVAADDAARKEREDAIHASETKPE